MPEETLIVRGAREHNLRNIDVEIPRDKLTVVTGLSGSGKSSLAFDTIYAEGQRRYVESLSAYARQFLGLMEKPDVDSIEGLSPAISIQQKSSGHNPRSTVGTVTEVSDYLRLLYARAGTPHCPNCGRPVEKQSAAQIAEILLSWPRDTKIQLLAPLVRGRKGEFRELFDQVRRKGFVRAVVDGTVVDLASPPALNKRRNHDVAIIVDRLRVRPEDRGRLVDSLETSLKLGEGLVEVVRNDGKEEEDGVSQLFSETHGCAACGISMPELEPRHFSFNSPYGACPDCGGLGISRQASEALVVGDDSLSLLEGVILPWGEPDGYLRRVILPGLAAEFGFSLHDPWRKIPGRARDALLHGVKAGDGSAGAGRAARNAVRWEGILASVQRRYEETNSESIRMDSAGYMIALPCASCGGQRLKPESRVVTIAGTGIGTLSEMTIARAQDFLAAVPLRGAGKAGLDSDIAGPILREIRARLRFLVDVGLEYLTLNRAAESLSGGEAQRIRLATQIGSRLVGVLYILDEPSIGLHQRDNARLLDTLRALRDLGNTVIVVEHDEETIKAADHVIDLGPGAGKHGGLVVASGTVKQIRANARSLTGRYLSGKSAIRAQAARRPVRNDATLLIRNAREHNLRGIDVAIPLGVFVAIAGVSGSGKSTLVESILHRALARHFYRARLLPGAHDELLGLEHLDKVIDIDQSPIGRTPRSNPATYTGLFTPIRELFAELPESRTRGYGPGRFSFNVKGGRCESCQGDGLVRIEMHFLPDVYASCDVCKGRRYNRETLEVRFREHNIAGVLEMTVEEALALFGNQPRIRHKLSVLSEVGLGYIHLGQSAVTLSGGEAQRVKLATELSRRDTGRTLYILDEPTTGLHFEDVRMLLDVLHRLVDRGNTVLVIEHNLDVLKTADWIIDLGPEGGDRGGEIVAQGTPESVAASRASYTGAFLAPLLGRTNGRRRRAGAGP
jgi:excinuclease ABC subunit A